MPSSATYALRGARHRFDPNAVFERILVLDEHRLHGFIHRVEIVFAVEIVGEGGIHCLSRSVLGDSRRGRWTATTATWTSPIEGTLHGITEGQVCPNEENSAQIG